MPEDGDARAAELLQRLSEGESRGFIGFVEVLGFRVSSAFGV